MRHRLRGRSFSRKSAHRKAMFENLAAALIKHDRSNIKNIGDKMDAVIGLTSRESPHPLVVARPGPAFFFRARTNISSAAREYPVSAES